MTEKTLSIAIIAFNEEENIGVLLKDVVSQKEINFNLDNIIISSDGSTDNTVDIAKNFKKSYPKIIIKDNQDRKGKAERINEIVSECESDILVILDADILLGGELFISNLVDPIINSNIDLTSSTQVEKAGTTLISKVLLKSIELKNIIYQQYNEGQNVYTCHGHSRAFSKRYYKTLHLKSSVGEDAYSYLHCIKNNFKYSLVPSALATYYLPDNLKDHLNQSERFFNSKNVLAEEFGWDFVKECYKIPKTVILRNILKSLFSSPVHTSLYLLIALYANLKSRSKKISSTWDMAESTKKFTREYEPKNA